jgi:putative peptidoglycan lipid II flippase
MGLAFLTTALVARAFGTSAEMDAYTLAISVPESLQYLLLLATLGILFTPFFIDLRVRLGDEAAWSMALSALALVALMVMAILPVLWVMMPSLVGLLAPGFDATTRALAVEFSILLLPGLFYYATAGLLMGICYAHHDLRTVALSTILLAGLNLAVFFVFVSALGLGVRGLVIGRLLALGIMQVFLLGRTLRLKRDVRVRFQLAHPEVVRILAQMPPYVFGALSGQVALAVNRAFVSTLGEGGVAAWGYGQRLADIPIAVIGAAFGATFLPDFGAALSANEREGAARNWNRALLRVALTLTPAAALIVVLREPLIALLFQRGAFDAESTRLSGLVLAGLALGLPLRAMGGLVVRGMPALKVRALPLILSVISTGANIVLAFWWVGPLGLFGIALAATMGDALFALIGIAVFWRWLGDRQAGASLISFAKIVAASLAGALASAWLLGATQDMTLWLRFALAGGTGLVVCAVVVLILRVPESATLFQRLVGRAAQSELT